MECNLASHSVASMQHTAVQQGTAGLPYWPRALRPAALQGMRPMPGVRIEDMGHKMG